MSCRGTGTTDSAPAVVRGAEMLVVSRLTCAELLAAGADGLRTALVLALLVGGGTNVMAQTTGRAARPADRPVPSAWGAFARPGEQAANQQSRDSLANGFWVGGGVGFAIGFLGAWAVNADRTASGPVWSSENAGVYASIGLVGGAVGALAGTAIDALKARHETDLIQRPASCRVVLAIRRQGMWCRLTL